MSMCLKMFRWDHNTCMQNIMLFNSISHYAPDIVTISAPLNGDQLCGHVYIAWPNYCNHCCRQQIKVSWDWGYLLGRKCSQGGIVSAQSSCFTFKTILVTDLNSLGITNLCFPWPNYRYIVIASVNPSIWLDSCTNTCFMGSFLWTADLTESPLYFNEEGPYFKPGIYYSPIRSSS